MWGLQWLNFPRWLYAEQKEAVKGKNWESQDTYVMGGVGPVRQKGESKTKARRKKYTKKKLFTGGKSGGERKGIIQGDWGTKRKVKKKGLKKRPTQKGQRGDQGKAEKKKYFQREKKKGKLGTFK